MNTLLRKLAIAGGLATALAAPLGAAPLTPAERTDYKTAQQHEARDVQTGDYRPHGTLTTQQRDSLARQDRHAAPKTPAHTNTQPLHAPY